MEKVVVEASQKSTDNTNYSHRDNIHHMIPNNNITHIKHDKAPSPKKPTFPRIAYFNESPEHHHHNCCAKESPPEKCTSPPCCHLFKRKQDTTHWSPESCTYSRGSTACDEITAITIIVEVAKPAPFYTVIIRAALA